MPRLTSDMFVSALLRRVTSEGGFGAVVAKGFAEAGTVHVEWRWRGEEGLLSPAPPSLDMLDGGERRFSPVPDVADETAISERMASERRFDDEAWHVAIEGVDPRSVLDVVD